MKSLDGLNGAFGLNVVFLVVMEIRCATEAVYLTEKRYQTLNAMAIRRQQCNVSICRVIKVILSNIY